MVQSDGSVVAGGCGHGLLAAARWRAHATAHRHRLTTGHVLVFLSSGPRPHRMPPNQNSALTASRLEFTIHKNCLLQLVLPQQNQSEFNPSPSPKDTPTRQTTCPTTISN